MTTFSANIFKDKWNGAGCPKVFRGCQRYSTPQHQQHIFVIYPLAIRSPRDIWNASSNDADVPVRWFCVVCPKAARHIHLWNNPIALFLPHLTGVLRGLLMGVICPLVLSKWSKYIWVDIVAAQMHWIAWNQKESFLVLEWKMSGPRGVIASVTSTALRMSMVTPLLLYRLCSLLKHNKTTISTYLGCSCEISQMRSPKERHVSSSATASLTLPHVNRKTLAFPQQQRGKPTNLWWTVQVVQHLCYVTRYVHSLMIFSLA